MYFVRSVMFALMAGVASAQEPPKPLVCPLSDEQVRRSMDAFAKIVPTLTQEPRCVNCHGAVNPFLPEPGESSSDPAAPRRVHAGGHDMVPTADCSACHDGMMAKRDGSPSVWRLPDPPHMFLGKDAKALCVQLKSDPRIPSAAEFISHLTDDRGNSNFTGTSFLGNRGIAPSGADKEFRLEPPKHITAGGLVALGRDWVAAMGGEFQGDATCGCEPMHYAVRVTFHSTVKVANGQFTSHAPPVDIPMKFHDDGSFSGEADQRSGGSGSLQIPQGMCTSSFSTSVRLRVSGSNTQMPTKSEMSLKLENSAPMTSEASGSCPTKSASAKDDGHNSQHLELPFTMAGNVGETAVVPNVIPFPNVESELRLELVKLAP